MDNIDGIKQWLGTGSINILGIQFSGKDTVGLRLAKILNAEFISSGDIVRANSEKLNNKNNSDKGLLTPTKEFSKLMENYLLNETPKNKPLILSSVGRWLGEETGIMQALVTGGHPLRAVIVLDISEKEVYKRWEIAKTSGERIARVDDMDKSKVARRIAEFKDKTLPVIEVYRQMGLVIEVNGEASKNEVFDEVINKLYSVSQM